MYVQKLAAALVAGSLFALVGPASAEKPLVKVSWYKCCNPHTASMKPFSADNPDIVAHKSLPFGTRVWFRNPKNGKTLCTQVDDRGPFVKGRDFDLTRGGAKQLGIIDSGVAVLEVKYTHCTL